MKYVQGVACATAVALSAPALAAVSTFESLVPLRNSHQPFALDLPQFNESFGTLDRVELAFAVVYGGTSRGENTSGLHGTKFYSMIDYDARVFTPAGMVVARTRGTEDFEGVLGEFDGSVDYAGRSGYAYEFTSEDAAFFAIADRADLQAYIGPNTITFHAIATADVVFDGDIGLIQSFETAGYVAITVRYHYTIPAPGTVAIAILGLAFRRPR